MPAKTAAVSRRVPRRIAVVSPRLTGCGATGGAEILLEQLARRALLEGVETVFLTTCARDHVSWQNTEPSGRRDISGLPVEFFPVDGNRDADRFHRLQERIGRGARLTADEETDWLANGPNSTALCGRLRELLPSLDAVVTGPYLLALVHAVAAVAGRKTRIVPCLHDEPFARLNAVRTLFASVGGIIFNSEPERDLACRLYDLSAGSGHVVGMGLTPFKPAPAQDLAFPYLLYCGRREPLKGTSLLLAYLDVFRRRTGSDLKLVLTGTGQVEPPPALAAAVIDLGFVTEERKHAVMTGALAFCHPSVNESFGIVLLEAWLAGTPALVHARGDVLPWHCRRAGGGLWFGDYAEFEEALQLLLAQPDLRRCMGEAGRRYVLREYDWSAIDQRFLAALG